ncbi:hypothetical protein M422DRAFT_786403 [Sphaerobolus stellatus SS14]|uniref:Uncharacterized protein n=1 Tax=Sphaerobolus stellatus (strain SS14) TaxID=990650 RepID=A0A0C9T1E5_SPHS4|nr:hypothetical protein M422DRAFT_786403 [Sphaerobolus stellatus SS14]
MLIALALEAAAMMALVFLSLPKDVATSLPPGLRHIHSAPCIGIFAPREFASLWIPPLLMQSFLSILVVIRYYKTQINGQTTGQRAIINVFVRDHLWAYMLVFAISLFATLSYELTTHLGETALTWTYTTLGFVGSRLILNLKSEGRTRMITETFDDSSEEVKFSSVAFVARGDRFGTSNTYVGEGL